MTTGQAMEKRIHEFFEHYQHFFRQGFKGEADMEQVASSHAAAFVAASPAGVVAGQNGEQLQECVGASSATAGSVRRT